MKGNFKSLTDLATEIERHESTKNDYVADVQRLEMTGDEMLAVPKNGNWQEFIINEYAHGQLASKLDIPKAYYDRMEQIPGLRKQNVNAWLHQPSKDRKRLMVRTLDNTARAILSDRFKPFDNMLVLSAFLPAVQQHGDLQVMSSSLTERKLYLQFRFPRLEGEVQKGDVVQSGLVLTNSEVGAGAVDVKSMIWRLVCTNGMIAESVLRKYHVGRKIGDSDDDYSLFADDTIQAELKAFQLKLRDILKDALSETVFQNQLLKMRAAVDDKIVDLPATVENVTKRFLLTEGDGKKILTNMVAEGRSNHRWGLVNGITALATQIENPDRAYEFEKLGNKVLNLKPVEWQQINVVN